MIQPCHGKSSSSGKFCLVTIQSPVSYQVLYSGVDPAEAQSIVTKLQGMQVPYELSETVTSMDCLRRATDYSRNPRLPVRPESEPPKTPVREN